MATAMLCLAARHLNISHLLAFPGSVNLVPTAYGGIQTGISQLVVNGIGIDPKRLTPTQEIVYAMAIKALSVALSTCGGYSLTLKVFKRIPLTGKYFASITPLPKREIAVLLTAVAIYEALYLGAYRLMGPAQMPVKEKKELFLGPAGEPQHALIEDTMHGATLLMLSSEDTINANSQWASKRILEMTYYAFLRLMVVGSARAPGLYYVGFFKSALVSGCAANIWEDFHDLIRHFAAMNSASETTSLCKSIAVKMEAYKRPIAVALEALSWVGAYFLCIATLGMKRQGAARVVGMLALSSALERLASFVLRRKFEAFSISSGCLSKADEHAPDDTERLQKPGEGNIDYLERLSKIIIAAQESQESSLDFSVTLLSAAIQAAAPHFTTLTEEKQQQRLQQWEEAVVGIEQKAEETGSKTQELSETLSAMRLLINKMKTSPASQESLEGLD